ncbi:MAG: Hsp20/alpha crystallin family protein [Anaerolineales bacterium]|nr:Hsp20/alpha crystallin family protein [Anaerolineales bacterium]
MTTLVRWNPSRSLWNEFDRFFNTPAVNWDAPRTWGLPLDVTENDEAYVVKASVPGISAEDLDVTLEDNVLTIKGEIAADEKVEDVRYHIRERRFGSFSRSLRFPMDVNADGVEASYVNGVLSLNVPKAEEVKPKQITVKVNE